MNINQLTEKDINQLREKGYLFPNYDRKKVIDNTVKNPKWIHFGGGNIFRAYQAELAQTLLNEGEEDTGIIVIEGYDGQIIEDVYKPYDNLSVLVTLKSDGNLKKEIVGSIADAVNLQDGNGTDLQKAVEYFKNPALQIATFTITEKGYSIKNNRGEYYANVKADMNEVPSVPQSYIGKVTFLLYNRFKAGSYPISMVSMDNCSGNGDKLRSAVLEIAETWNDPLFLEYLTDTQKVAFPWTMIDKITPRPNENIRKMLMDDGLQNMDVVITDKYSYVAPFVNTEECEYLVVEDQFPNGRPKLEKAGVIFTDRETVKKVEKMKVSTCLNPIHTALAVFGCLLGYTLIADEMKDPTLKKISEILGYIEGMPVVTDPKILSPKDFLYAVLNIRVPNPYMPDTPQRIATDTSQKLAVRYGETVKAYLAEDPAALEKLEVIPCVYAGWIRYLMGMDDSGNAFTRSPDPLLESLNPIVEDLHLGVTDHTAEIIEPIMERTDIFGYDVTTTVLYEKTIKYLNEMLEGPGAIRRTLQEVAERNRIDE